MAFQTRTALFPLTSAGVCAVLLAAASPIRAERWSAWAELPDAPLVARFETSIDTRLHVFQSDNPASYANLFARIPFPGTLVLETAAGGAGVVPGTALRIAVEAVSVDMDRSGAPKAPKDAHFASNPLLPFVLPSGASRPPFATVVSGATAPDAGEVARIPVLLPFLRWRDMDGIVRVRWSAAEAGSGRVLARGVLPCAFSQYEGGRTPMTLVATGDGRAHVSGNVCRPTPATSTAWPTLASDVAKVVFDGAGLDAAFGAAPEGSASTFLARARLVGVSLVSRDPAAAMPEGRDVLVPQMHRNSSDGATPLSETQVGRRYGADSDPDDPARAALEAANEALLEPARIPGEALGRPYAPFAVATVVFLTLFAIGAVAILVRHFALRRGEARLAVWRALPLWSAASAVVAFLALPRMLDRRPYADVTEWRYGFADSDEAFCIAQARTQSFAATSSSWSIPGDAWFFVGPNFFSGSSDPGMVVSIGGEADRSSVTLPPRLRGEEESIMACRFAPHRSPVSLTSDPALDVQALTREALLAPEAEGSDSASRDVLARLLGDWSAPPSGPPERPLRPAPERSVTASADLDGVFVWARGSWYALGPMKRDETRALAPERRIWSGMDLRDKPWKNLFDDAPFALTAKDVTTFANAWLARNAATRKADGGAGNDEGGDDGKTAAVALSHYEAQEVARLVRKLGSAFVVAIRNADSADAPFLAPEFPDGPETGRTTGRIVYMEVFP